MARVKIDLPDHFAFSTEFRVTIGQVNAAYHLGNDTLISLLNESFLRFLEHKGFPELIVDGLAVVNADLTVIYKSEAFRGDVLKIEGAAVDLASERFNYVCRVTNTKTGKEVAVSRIGMVFFDLQRRKNVKIPDSFRQTC